MLSVIVKSTPTTARPDRADPRARMIRSAAVLIRERGVEATSLADVIAHSGAPRGSIYHHFPGGKTQLVEEATAYAAEYIGRGLAAALAGADPQSALRAFAATWRGILEQSDFGAGCPVVASTLEGDRNPAARAIAGEGFASWQAMVADALAGRGVERERASAVAALAVAAIEGGVILARAQRSLAPLEGVADELVRIVDAALAEAGAS